ncbi:MAG: hypothetical protein AAF682_25545 [Planctomycetota bacterium]
MTDQTGSRDGRVGTQALVLLFVLALVLRVGFALDYAGNHPLADRPVIDEESYERWALEIADGDWVGDEVFFQEPLYPYWLGSVYAVWGIGDDEEDRTRRRRTSARHLHALYGALSVVLLTLLTARVFGRTAALAAGVGLATYRPLLFLPSLLLKPNLVVPLVLVLGYLALRARVPARGWRGYGLWALFGLTAGLGALLRGNLLLLVPLFVALPVARALLARSDGARPADGARAAAAVLLGVVCALLPVALRNQAVGGVFALTTSGAGTNLYGGNNAENPYGRATEFSWVRGIPEYEADDWKHEAERRTGRVLDPGEVSSFWIGETLDSLRSDPLLHARILWNKLRLSLGAYEVPDNHHIEWDARYVSALRLPLPGYWLWGALGIGGMLAFALRRWLGGDEPEEPRHAWELLLFYLLYLATIVATVTSMRIRVALVPLLLPFAGYLIALFWGRKPSRAWLGPFIAAAAIVSWPVFSEAEQAEDLLKRDYNHAVYLLREGRLDEAQDVVGLLEAERPGAVSVRLLSAELAYRRGAERLAAGAPGAEVEPLLDLAMTLLRPVAQGEDVAPRDRFRAQKLAGLIQFDVGGYDVAERRFREALAFDPTDRDIRLRLANLLWIRAEGLEGLPRTEALAEARAILDALLAEQPSSELEARLAEVEAELARG